MRSVKALLLSVDIFIVIVVAAVIGLTARRNMLDQITISLDAYKKTLYEGYDNAVEYQVQSVVTLLQGIYDRQQKGELTEAAAKKEAIKYVKALRYGKDDGGYFWVDDTDYILIAHPILEEQEGDNRYDLKDQNGVMIIQEILKTVQSSKEGGFNEFYYTKADGVTVAPKRAYSMLFEPWGWVISSGNYIDDIEKIYDAHKGKMDLQLRRQIQMTNLCVAVMVVVSIFISIIYAQKFTKPLRKIRDLAVRLSKCDLSQPASIKSKNEFGQTAQTLNNAQEILKTYINDISRILHEMAEGNFEVEAEAEYEGEFIEIYNSMKTIKNSLNNTLAQIDDVAVQVSFGSEQISNISQQLAQATMQQTGSVQNVSVRMEEVLAQAEHNSQNAEKAKDCVIQAEKQIETGVEMMGKLSQAIQDISEASDNIGKIIKNIDDISFQTNLLALNASVEAARAGEAGKGFAVVADEVSSLAQKSISSANTTHELIESSIRTVKKGIQIAADTEKSLFAIVEENKAIHNLVMEIARDSAEQAESSGYINQQIGNISSAAQANSATVQQSAASSEELSQQAAIMKELVEKFNIRKQI